MKSYVFRFLTIGVLLFNALSGYSQILGVNYQIRYNSSNCLWDCYMVITSGSATSTTHRTQASAQYTLIVPTGSTVTVIQNHMPLRDNQSYTGTIPTTWVKSSEIYAPAAQPQSDFYAFSPSLSPSCHYNNLATGDTIKLFSVRVTPGVNCGDGVRNFTNGVDPSSSAPGMGGGDFSNGMTIGTLRQLYKANEPKVNPPAPIISAVATCANGLEIDLTATNTACLMPFTYNWSGPNGYTGTSQDVNINPATSVNNGTYLVTVTNSAGCTATTSVNAVSKPSAGPDQNACKGQSTTLTGTNPTSGTWAAAAGNPSGASLGTNTGGVINVNFSTSAAGVYSFIYANGNCQDTVSITVIDVNGGDDPSSVGCFSSGTAVMAATSPNGTWSVDPSSPGTATFTDPNSPNTTLLGFSAPGTYTLRWTFQGCFDIVQVVVNNNCSCAIANNTIPPINPTSYCGTTSAINIDGATPNPSGGTFTWQYSFNSGAYNVAGGTNNQEDYTTAPLSTGTHRFRRIYSISNGTCNDTSNIITITVNDAVNVPTGLTAQPNPVCLGNVVNLSVNNNPGFTYVWSASSTSAGLSSSTTSTTTMNALASGTYTISVTQSANGCTSPAASVQVTVNPTPPTPNSGNTSGQNPAACLGTDGSITISGLAPSTFYTLNYSKNNNPLTANISSNSSGVLTLSNLSSGTYTNFSLTSVQGCTSGIYAGPVTLSDPNAPAPPVGIAANPSSACTNVPITLSVTNNPGATYAWTASSTAAGLVSSTTNTTTMTALQSGIFNIFVTQTVGGCTSGSASIAVSITSTPATPNATTLTSTNPTVCAGANGTISLSGLTPSAVFYFSYSKNGVPRRDTLTSNGSGVITAVGLTAGTYSNFSVTNFNQCASGVFSGPITLSDPSSPAAPANLTATPNPACLGSPISLSTTAVANATFNWSASSTAAGLSNSTNNTNVMNPTVVGSYTISVSLTLNGCTSPASNVTVVVNATPPTPTLANIAPTNPTTCGSLSGSIAISGLANSTAYTIQYERNNQPVSINIVTNASGVATIANLNAGSYSNFRIISASGCASGLYAGPVVLSDPNAPSAPAGIAANPNPVCTGTTVNLSVTNNSGAVYSWSSTSTNAGLVSSSTNTTTMSTMVPGTYVVSVTQNVAGCISPAASVSVTVNGRPPAPSAGSVTSTNPTSCSGSDGTISISGLTPSIAYTISYSKNGTPQTANVTANGSGVAIITGLTSGNYTGFSVSSGNGCPSDIYNGVISLSDPGAPSAPANLTANPNPSCLGTTVSLSVTNNPGATYNWGASLPAAGLNPSSFNTTSMVATTPGSYTINVTQTVAGCTSPAASVIVVVNPIPAALTAQNITGNNPTTCGGSEGSFSLSGLPPNTTYTLSYNRNGVPASAVITTSSTGTASVSSLTGGNYTNFRLTGTGNCQSPVFAGPIVLTGPAEPAAPSGLTANPNPVCAGTAVALSVTNNPGASYSWTASSSQAGLVSSLSNTTSMTSSVAGQYTISVTQTVNNCTSPAATVIVNVNPVPPTPSNAVITKSDPTTCLGSNGSITLGGYSPNTGYIVDYQKNGNPTQTNVTSNLSGQIIITGLTAGTYSNFKVTNAQQCSSGVFTGSIILSDPPAQGLPTNLTANPNPACVGTTIQLNVNNEQGATYSWSASGAGAGLSPSSSNTTTLLPVSAGTYTISVTKTVAGCVSGAATVSVLIHPVPPTPTASSITTINPTCARANGSITIGGLAPSATFTINYRFNGVSGSQSVSSNANGAATITNLLAGSYTDFRVTNEFNCASGIFAGPVVLTDPGLPPAPTGLAANPNHICIRSTIDLSVNLNQGAVYSWSASGTGLGLTQGTTNTVRLIPTMSGTYTVSVTQTINGCTSPAATIELTVRPDCFNPDFNVTYVNISVAGDVSTNDTPIPMKTYDNVQAMAGNPSTCLPVLSPDGTYNFVCAVAGKYNFMVNVCHGVVSTSCAQVPLTITVLESGVTNNPPVVNVDYARTKTGIPVAINILANDKCQNSVTCALGTPTILTNPLNGTFNTGTMIYTPAPGFMGRDSFRYNVCQTPAVTPVHCGEAWVYITVLGANAPNVTNAMDDYNQTPLGTTLTVNAVNGLMRNDTDPEGNRQAVTSSSQNIAGVGSLTINSDGSYTFTPTATYIGPVEFPYEVCDNNVAARACDSATLHILVEPFVPRATIGDRVWHDTNGDGLQSSGESGIANIPVRLYNALGILVDTTRTNSTGNYLFENVQGGTYYLEFVKSGNYEFIFANAGADDKDSDVNHAKGFGTTSMFEILTGENNLTLDAGLYICSKIGNLVWYDANKNDKYDKLENGINGLKVNLYRFHNGAWVIWTHTFTGTKPGSVSDDGYFEFCVPPGQYYVEVIMPEIGLVQVKPRIGTSTTDSDLTNAFGKGTTSSFTLTSGQNKMDIGAGYYPMAVAGNIVWQDQNENGAKEPSEPVLENVKVQVFDAKTNKLISQTRTNAEGKAYFEYLEKQEVYFKFEIDDKFTATRALVGTPDKDSDVDHANGPNTTRSFDMQPGDKKLNIDLGLTTRTNATDWLYITANKQAESNLIKWGMKKEINISHYEIERRIGENGEFLPLTLQIEASNLIGRNAIYEVVDHDINKKGKYFYRVKQVDKIGKHVYSNIVSISPVDMSNIKLAPSVASNQTVITFELVHDSKVNLKLLDNKGSLIHTIQDKVMKTGEHQIPVDLTGLVSGVYNIVTEIDGIIVTKKLIKQL